MEIRDYLVVSPEMTFGGYGGLEPPEVGCAAVEVQAPSARPAIIMALQSREFREWVQQQRSDGVNPFTGVRAIRLDNLDDEW